MYLPSVPGTQSTTSARSSSISTWNNSTSTSQVVQNIPCSTVYSNGAGIGTTFQINENSTLLLCVRFYYYGSSAPQNFSTMYSFAIRNNATYPGDPNKAMLNFTVTTQPSNFTIGGPSNENEGILVLYRIRANYNSNGTYILNLGWIAPAVDECGADFGLVVGNGSPDYYSNFMSYCITMTMSGSGSSSYPYPAGTLFSEVVGSDNSTG